MKGKEQRDNQIKCNSPSCMDEQTSGLNSVMYKDNYTFRLRFISPNIS